MLVGRTEELKRDGELMGPPLDARTVPPLVRVARAGRDERRYRTLTDELLGLVHCERDGAYSSFLPSVGRQKLLLSLAFLGAGHAASHDAWT